MNTLSDIIKFQHTVIDKAKIMLQNEEKITNLLRNLLKSIVN